MRLAAVLLFILPISAICDERELKVPSEQVTSNSEKSRSGYLGFAYDVISDSLRGILPDAVESDQGVVVTRFATSSPAAEQGLKVHDVLLSYEGKSIKEPEKLVEWIRAGQPGTTITMTILRQSKQKKIDLVLGGQDVAPVINKTVVSDSAEKTTLPVSTGNQGFPPMTVYPIPAHPVQQQGGYQVPSVTPQNMNGVVNPNAPALPPASMVPDNNFNGLAIRNKGQDVYEASIGFIDASGKMQRRTFVGNRQQLYSQVLAAQDLPQHTRQQLLFAIGPRQPANNNQFFGMPMNNFRPDRWFNGW